MRFNGNPKLDYVLILDELPKLYEEHFQPVVQRASNLVNLPDHNIHLLNDAVLSLSTLIVDEFDNRSNEDSKSSNSPEILFNNLGILSNLNFNLKDAQYFGLLALSLVDEAILVENHMHPKSHQYDWGMEDEVLSCLTAATEAVCFGESLEHLDSSISSSIKTEVKRRALKATDKRYEPIRRIKNNFLRFIDKNDHIKSNAQAARLYFRSLNANDQKILCHTLIEANAVRTLTDYLREYRKKLTIK